MIEYATSRMHFTTRMGRKRLAHDAMRSVRSSAAAGWFRAWIGNPACAAPMASNAPEEKCCVPSQASPAPAGSGSA